MREEQHVSHQQKTVILDSNDLSEAIVENIHHALLVLNKSLRIVRVNERFREIFRIRPEIGAGAPLFEAFSNARLISIVTQALESDEAMWETEFSYSEADEEERHFLLDISKIRSSSDEYLLVTFDEVTEWKRSQTQVMEASRLVSVGEMAAGIAHEVNNPLAAVMGFSQLVLRREMEDGVRKDIEKIFAEAKRASKIITNLQSFARRYKPRKEPVNLVDIVQKVLDFRAYELQVNDIEVVTDFGSGTYMTVGDTHQLDQVFLNLISNAETFTAQAHGDGTLTVKVSGDDDKVRVSITDDGPGIREEDIPKIFDPFFTTKEVGQGTGLGLSLCYGIIHEHDGVISVESSLGKGSTFTVELPRGEPPSQAMIDLESLVSAKLVARMNVLVIEDEPPIAEFVSQVLSEEGHTVDTTHSGDTAVNEMRLADYDMIIMDMKMPGLSGAALFDYIKDHFGDEVSSKVVFITGDTTNSATGEFINKTGNPLLTKPFSLDDLLTVVGRFAMRQRRDGSL